MAPVDIVNIDHFSFLILFVMSLADVVYAFFKRVDTLVCLIRCRFDGADTRNVTEAGILLTFLLALYIVYARFDVAELG